MYSLGSLLQMDSFLHLSLISVLILSENQGSLRVTLTTFSFLRGMYFQSGKYQIVIALY